MIENKYTRFERYTEYMPSESRWAEPSEIKADSTEIDLSADACPVAGLPLISDGEKAWVDGKDNHALIFGSTGSKKTRLFVMPMINMMIKAGESFIATDPKGELYERTAGLAKASGYDVKVLNFREIGKGECWNPLHYPYQLYKRGEVDKATALLSDFITVVTERQEASGKQDPFWVDSARALGMGNLLLLMEAGNKEEANALSLARMCDFGLKSKFMVLLEQMDPTCACAVNLGGVLSSADNTLRSVMITLFSTISIFVSQRDLMAMLSRNTIDVKTFGDKKTAFYLIVPDEKTSTHFLVTSFIKQAYEMLIERAQEEESGRLKVRMNFVLDEFCNVPRIPDMPNMISAARSRNIRYFLVAQSLHQLESRYGEDDANTIKGNCLNWVFLSSKEIALLKEISDLCGTCNTALDGGNRYTTTPLISTSQLQRLDKNKGEALILHDRCYPFITMLPDIDQYLPFRGHSAPQLEKRPLQPAQVLSIGDLLFECKMGRRPFPFSAGESMDNESLN